MYSLIFTARLRQAHSRGRLRRRRHALAELSRQTTLTVYPSGTQRRDTNSVSLGSIFSA
jgi:hypothetical protein